MPITYNCSCGKTLRVKDELAGRRVRCPVCGGASVVPAADPGFEVVDDVPPAPVRARATPAARTGDEDDRPRTRKPADEDRSPGRRFRDDDRPDADDDDDRPRSRRDEDDEDQPRKKKKTRRKKEAEPQPTHFGFERRVLNAGVGGGLLAMIGAVVWFVVGLMADRIFFYPPVLFVIGLVAMVKGIAGGDGE